MKPVTDRIDNSDLAYTENPQIDAPSRDIAVAPANSPMALIQQAIANQSPIETVEKLMDLALRWEQKEARKEFYCAMSKFRGMVRPVSVNREASFDTKKYGGMSYLYATLDQICAHIDPLCNQVGLSYRWENQQELTPSGHHRIVVTCHVYHASGHSESSTMEATPDTTGLKNAVQAVGSAITYLRRYTLGMALGISTTADTDTQDIPRSSDKPPSAPEPSAPEPREEKPAYTLADMDINMPKWIKLVRDGKKTPDQIVKMLKRRFELTSDMERKIMEIKK